MNYKKLNNITGWLVFAVAACTYILTVEPSASLWDCSEFITSAYKLEVGHPPGAPLFAMLGHLFTMFVAPQHAAIAVNIFSALCSAFTILFLFWSITMLTRKLSENTIVVMACGLIGALIYTFSDTFWFSAVEGEVYAASSLITAVVFWAILKWEEQADTKHANRWLVLIAYITGLSIGVHLLNLLVIPTIVFVYYFKKYRVSRAGLVKTSLVSVVLLGSVIWGIIPGMPEVASWFEILFVNTMRLPINSGVLFFVILLMFVLSYFIYITNKRGKKLMNTVFLSLAFCLLGYGSYAMIVIRSSTDTPMNQNKPNNIFALVYYLNRTQYGASPLISGQYYTDASDYELVQDENYVLVGDRYVKKTFRTQKYRKNHFFSRMWSDRRPGQIQIYKKYTSGTTPSFRDNLHFFIDYQLGFMYWRYFMWNFAGRQNDMQASPDDPTRGNWISGIKPFDEARLGSTENQPKYLAENKGHNKYYLLPLILGLLGLVYQFRHDKKGFTVVTLLFFFTGIAIILYLNQAPNEPRERDYAYAGSFYAFAIWIGMGIAFVHKLLKRALNDRQAACLALVAGLPVPILMAQQNWDDHDRSGRYITTDFGYNYLNSCDKNAVLYTHGDNDTFALWYNQEVEGVRTDIKVVNTQYIHSDWYYTQMMKQAYDSPPLKTIATTENIAGESRYHIYTLKNFGKEKLQLPYCDLRTALEKYIFNDDPATKIKYDNASYHIVPSPDLRLPINREEVKALGIVKDTAAIVPYISFNASDGISLAQLAALDFTVNNFPQRSFYYGTGGDDEFLMGIDNNLRFEGLVSRLTPENTKGNPIDVDKTFEMLTGKFRYRGWNNPDVYTDECAKRLVLSCYRNAFIMLGSMLKYSGDSIRLKQLMEKYHEAIPEMEISNIMETPYHRIANPIVDFYFAAGLNEYATSLSQRLIDEYRREYLYYGNLNRGSFEYQLSRTYQGVKNLNDILTNFKQADLQKQAGELLSAMGAAR